MQTNEMVESDLSKDNIEEGSTKSDNLLWTSKDSGSSCHRDPSFSGWFDENGTLHSSQIVNRHNLNADDFDFELPKGKEINVSIGTETNQHSSNFKHRMMRGGGGDFASGEDRYVPFDVENGSSSHRGSVDDDEKDDSDDDDGRSAFLDYHDSPQAVSKNGAISEVDVLKTLFFILVWYSVSLFLTLYNKTLLGDHLGKFPAPLLMNTVHFTMQAVLSKAITGFWSQRFQPTVMMSWRDYSLKVVPTALTTAMDVNLSNASLVFISVTFATMCKSASPIFLLFFAFAFRLESPSVKLLVIILVISVGILLTVAKETEFEFWGFVFVMLAAVMSGFRWSMTQILLQKEAYGLKNPLTLMSYVTPVMAISTAFLSLIFDPWHKFGHTNYFDSSWHIARSCLLMLFGGTLAFFMVLTEYILVSITSAVTVTIAGVVKEAVTILVAVFYFHDDFTWMKGFGLMTIMFGVSLFNWYKYDKLQKGSACEDEIGSPLGNAAAKYVILEEMEDQDHGP
ncbi:probable sugar phosphate/phosphate translocator At1g06470 [Lycium ferocissimum]|uniref:probable sugar phosphate/phosphate translocator At1g06470 n=1 Tax=Lycium ferocissimum TaxID=112874 RepID=UPI0028164FF9|nr:probable sugar phosphate/phosphate translocator At1g06470 [Lycium ferocissimum]XP_059291576.1 probable sugar phosphate/phosphate translocator At1g06470 [Lycium ferocissimum]XP_059291577.1 probable sugar phosphate/phosphate translocator At1g06470 [Lycium ferocissimum]